MEAQWETATQMDSYTKIMLALAVLGRAFLILQIATIISNGSSEDASFTSYLLLFIISLAWLAYGIKLKQTVMVTSSFIGTVFSMIAMFVTVGYKQDKTNLL